MPCGDRCSWCVASVVDVAAALAPGDTRLQLLIVDGAMLRAPGVAAWWAQGAGLGPARRTHIHPVHLSLPTLHSPGRPLRRGAWTNALLLQWRCHRARGAAGPRPVSWGTAPAPPCMGSLALSFSQLRGRLSPHLILTCSLPTAPSLLTSEAADFVVC